MKVNFCTLFNTNYMSRGLVMYDSLIKHCADFHLYVFAFDDHCFDYLNKKNLPHLTAISLTDFEDEALLLVKKDRTAAEYCWTSTSSTILYCMEQFNLSNCTYLDADLQFFSNPLQLIEEMGDNSVLITEHRYSPSYDQSLESGKYCVQFVTFKNDDTGMKVLRDWRDDCLEWCYARIEDGKFGDQKYLDAWMSKYKGIHELKHLGGGIAPWNVQQYNFRSSERKLIGTNIVDGKDFPVVFFHFHGVQFFDDDIVSYAGARYDLNAMIQELFYEPYIRLLNQKKDEIREQLPDLNPNGSSGKAPYAPMSFKVKFMIFLSELKNTSVNRVIPNLKKRISNHYFHYSRKL